MSEFMEIISLKTELKIWRVFLTKVYKVIEIKEKNSEITLNIKMKYKKYLNMISIFFISQNYFFNFYSTLNKIWVIIILTFNGTEIKEKNTVFYHLKKLQYESGKIYNKFKIGKHKIIFKIKNETIIFDMCN